MKDLLSLKVNTTQHCFPIQIARKYRTSLRLTRLILFLTISVYDYLTIGPSSVVYIFDKGIFSLVLCT